MKGSVRPWTVNPMSSQSQVSKTCAHQLSETEEIGHTYSAQEKKYLLFETFTMIANLKIESRILELKYNPVANFGAICRFGKIYVN